MKSGYWGIGVGLAFVLNGKVHYGEDFSAGEFQSILWKEPNQGQFSLGDAAARRIRKDRAVLVKVQRELCAHIAFLVNVLNLTCVVFGGVGLRDRVCHAGRQSGCLRRGWHVRCRGLHGAEDRFQDWRFLQTEPGLSLPPQP